MDLGIQCSQRSIMISVVTVTILVRMYSIVGRSRDEDEEVVFRSSDKAIARYKSTESRKIKA